MDCCNFHSCWIYIFNSHNNIAAFGQLENNLRWEVVFFHGHCIENQVRGSKRHVRGERSARIRWEFTSGDTSAMYAARADVRTKLSYLLRKEGVKVVRTMLYEVDKEFWLKSNTRVATISADKFQMSRANTTCTIVRIICRIARMICVARIIVSQPDYC